MSGINYSKWDALVDSDDEKEEKRRKAKQQYDSELDKLNPEDRPRPGESDAAYMERLLGPGSVDTSQGGAKQRRPTMIQTKGEPIDMMDEAEQEKLVEQLRAQCTSQSRTSRAPLMALFALLALVAFGRHVATAMTPDKAPLWSSALREPIRFQEILVAQLCQGGALTCAVFVAFGQPPGTWIRSQGLLGLGLSLSLVPFVTFSRAMFDEKYPWLELWVPLSGALSMLLAWFVDSECKRLDEEVADLEKLRYKFKEL